MRIRVMLIAILSLVIIPRPAVRASDLCDTCSFYHTVAAAAGNVHVAVNTLDSAVQSLNEPTYRVFLSYTNDLDATVEVIQATATRASLGIELSAATIDFLQGEIATVHSELQELLTAIQNLNNQENAAQDAVQDAATYDAVASALAAVASSIQALEQAACLSC